MSTELDQEQRDEQGQREELRYSCPNCESTIDISKEFVDETVDCPNCHHPFVAEAPSVRPIDPENFKTADAKYEINKPTDDETTIRSVHPAMFRNRPIRYIGLILSIVVVGAGLIWSAIAGYTVITTLLGVVLVVPLAYFGYWVLDILATTLTVTNKRTRLRTGILAKRTTEVQHDDVRNLQVNQTMFDRLFGVGTVAISSSGQDDLEIYVEGIPKPNDVADLVRRMQ